MGLTAEPRPAQLPLPGGSEGATVRLHPLLAGEMLSPPELLAAPKGRLARMRAFTGSRAGWIWLPIPAFLIEHPTAGLLLVDTGFHPSVAIDPQENFGRLWKRLLTFRVSREAGLHDQLRRRGFDPAAVTTVIMTHLHFDHASGISEFPEATFVVDQAEWDAAAGRRRMRNGYIKRHYDYAFDWRTIDYHGEEIDSYATFGAGVDLFGDGSIRPLSTPGHTAGHQSLLLRLRDRAALLCGDAAYTHAAIARTIVPMFMRDEHLWRRSLREIQLFCERHRDVLVIPGHDAEAWPKLRAVYE